jgi:hypothetical protein
MKYTVEEEMETRIEAESKFECRWIPRKDPAPLALAASAASLVRHYSSPNASPASSAILALHVDYYNEEWVKMHHLIFLL